MEIDAQKPHEVSVVREPRKSEQEGPRQKQCHSQKVLVDVRLQ